MEGNKGGGRAGAGEDEMSDGMHCINHPLRNNNNNNNPGGICAFCLQEKLGKLVSSSSSLPIRPSSSSSPSSSPSFRSDTASSTATTTHPTSATSKILTSSAPAPTSSSSKKNGAVHHHHYHQHYMRLPFLLAKKKKKPSTNSSSSPAATTTSDIIFKRSKSTATPRRRGQFMDEEEDDDDKVIEDFNFTPRKRNWFWSFLYLSSKPSSSSSTKKFDTKSLRENSSGSPRISAVNAASCTSRDKCSLGPSSLGRKSDMVVEEEEEGEEEEGASASSLERKVSRSRSVGCGSRSFSGDFFERISTGFGDCTLRRVESQREGKTKAAAVNRGVHHQHCMKERVMCGGLFGGFMMTSSSSSSSSSSYWVSSSADDGMNNGESAAHGRGKSWGWAFASPMRAFGTKTSSKDNKRENIRDASDKNATPNLSAIPSLLTVSS